LKEQVQRAGNDPWGKRFVGVNPPSQGPKTNLRWHQGGRREVDQKKDKTVLPGVTGQWGVLGEEGSHRSTEENAKKEPQRVALHHP